MTSKFTYQEIFQIIKNWVVYYFLPPKKNSPWRKLPIFHKKKLSCSSIKKNLIFLRIKPCSFISKPKQLKKSTEKQFIIFPEMVLSTAPCIIFWDFFVFYQIFPSPQVKQCAIITYKHGIYELPRDLPNDIRPRILGK